MKKVLPLSRNVQNDSSSFQELVESAFLFFKPACVSVKVNSAQQTEQVARLNGRFLSAVFQRKSQASIVKLEGTSTIGKSVYARGVKECSDDFTEGLRHVFSRDGKAISYYAEGTSPSLGNVLHIDIRGLNTQAPPLRYQHVANDLLDAIFEDAASSVDFFLIEHGDLVGGAWDQKVKLSYDSRSFEDDAREIEIATSASLAKTPEYKTFLAQLANLQ